MIVYKIIKKYIIIIQMAKGMNVHCNFLENNLTCVLLEHTMDVLLKVQARSGEHTFQEEVYTRTLKYRRWNNECATISFPKEKSSKYVLQEKLIFRQQ